MVSVGTARQSAACELAKTMHTAPPVELRENVPLSGSASAGVTGGRSGSWCGGGPRLVAACFAVLSAGITAALLAQVHGGSGNGGVSYAQLVPHGSVASSAADCSRAGTDLLKQGGRALDAAAAAALCLAVLAQHRTSLDASGSLLYWEYRAARTRPAQLAEWGGPVPGAGPGANRPPRLVSALAVLHARLGAGPWARVLEPAVRLARDGYNVSSGLAAALQARGESVEPGQLRTEPRLAQYLGSLQRNTSAELAAAWSAEGAVRLSSAVAAPAGRWRVRAGGPAAAQVTRAMAAALHPAPADADAASARAAAALLAEGTVAAAAPASNVASGLAVVDQLDTYAALVTGVSRAFGSAAVTAAGWTRDEPARPLDLAPAILTEESVCGTRFVVGAESAAALALAGSALATEGEPAAVEQARPVGEGAVNVVRQRGDALSSHADSRGGGLSSRF